VNAGAGAGADGRGSVSSEMYPSLVRLTMRASVGTLPSREGLSEDDRAGLEEMGMLPGALFEDFMALPDPDEGDFNSDLPSRYFGRDVEAALREFLYDGAHHARSEAEIVQWIRRNQTRSGMVDTKQRNADVFSHLKEVATRSPVDEVWTLAEDMVLRVSDEKEQQLEARREKAEQRAAKRTKRTKREAEAAGL